LNTSNGAFIAGGSWIVNPPFVPESDVPKCSQISIVSQFNHWEWESKYFREESLREENQM
jgi:hypothetical protein